MRCMTAFILVSKGPCKPYPMFMLKLVDNRKHNLAFVKHLRAILELHMV
jgi:hypothetical protein